MFKTFIFLTFTNPQLNQTITHSELDGRALPATDRLKSMLPLPYKVANFFPHRLTHSINKRGNFTFSSTLLPAKHLHSFRQDERHVEASF